MNPPLGYKYINLNHVCRLKKSLYGLKQAPLPWYEKFRTTILGVGFTQSSSDYSSFLRRTTSDITILLLYVDDMIITGNEEVGISHLKDLLHSSFEVKDLGKQTYFLGLEVSYGKEGIRLSQ